MLSSASPDFTFIDKNEKVLQCETWMEVWSLVSEWNAGYFNLRPSFQDRLYGIKTACVEAVWSRKLQACTVGPKQSESE
jgi:hypothetical protein